MMAGGWGRRGSGVPLADRVRADADGESQSRPGRGAETEVPPARHCWVADAADRAGVKRPGLLVEWRSTDAGWEGRVVYCAALRPERWCLVEEWVPAALLAPA